MNHEHAYYLSMQRLMKPVVEIAQDPDDNLEIGMMVSQTKGSAQGDLMNIVTKKQKSPSRRPTKMLSTRLGKHIRVSSTTIPNAQYANNLLFLDRQ